MISMFKKISKHIKQINSNSKKIVDHYWKHSMSFSTTFTNKSSVKLSYISYDTYRSSVSPVVIMHGLFGSKNNWNTLAKAINKQTKRRVITVDARNHGDSPHSSIMTYPSMADDVKVFLESLDIEKAILIGHSMGGAAMMCTALNYPNIVAKLLIVDMSPVKTSPSLNQMTDIIDTMLSIKFENSNTLSEARKRTDQLLSETIKSSSLRQFLLMNVVEKSPREFSWRVNLPVIANNFKNQIAVFPQIIPQLVNKTFDGPTFFIAGTESDYIKEQDHMAINKLFTNAKITYIEGAGHWVQSEKPAEFLSVTTAFINQ